jgi:predicted DNA-binding protein (UPF0251 family)
MNTQDTLNEVNRALASRLKPVTETSARKTATNIKISIEAVKQRIKSARKQAADAHAQANKLGALKLAAQARGLNVKLSE